MFSGGAWAQNLNWRRKDFQGLRMWSLLVGSGGFWLVSIHLRASGKAEMTRIDQNPRARRAKSGQSEERRTKPGPPSATRLPIQVVLAYACPGIRTSTESP